MARFDSTKAFFGKEGPARPGDERFRAIFELSSDALLIFDDDGCCVEGNSSAADLLGIEQREIAGQRLDRFIALPAPEDDAKASAVWAGLLAPGRQFRECAVLRPGGERRVVNCRLTLHFTAGFNLCQMQDDSDLKQVEESYRTLVEITNTGYAIMDPAGRLIDANAEYVRLSGHPALEHIVGRSSLEWTVPADHERFSAQLAACAAGAPVRNLEIDYCDPGGAIQPIELNASAIDTPEGLRVLALCRDISERREAQKALRAAHDALENRVRERTEELALANIQIHSRSLRQEIVASFGHNALRGASADALMREAVELVARTLGMDLCEVLELTPATSDGASGNDELLLRAGFGWPVDCLDRRIANSSADTLEGFVLRSREPLVVENLAQETRFQPPRHLRELEMTNCLCVTIHGETQPFGILGAHSRQPRAFSGDDVSFVHSIANVLAEVIERQRADDAIRFAQHEALQANNAKNDFLSRMSHELRTPLNAILGFGQLLEIEELGQSQRESVDQIVRAGRHLLDMVNEVLDIARIESGNLAMDPEPVSLLQVIREGVSLIHPLSDLRHIAVTVSAGLQTGAHFVLGDRQRMRQVVLNLLSNAVKYNHEGGRIALSLGAGSRPDRLRLEVADTGVGIAPDKITRLFTPFDRLGAEETNIEGDGIGLALSKRLMNAQGGDLGYVRQAAGSLFWIELPKVDEPALQEMPIDVLQSLLQETKIAVPSPAPEEQFRTVLHIEDNESNRLLVELLFVQRPSLHLLSATRGQEGLELARDRHPDLILLDMHLPDTPGEEVLHSLRADDRTRATPVVVISADASGPRIRHLREAGADDYLTKPFNVGQFFRMLDEHLMPAT